MKRILLYSPDVIGHPRVYCRVIADSLASEPCELVVAMGFTDKAGLGDSPDLWPLQSRDRLTLIDTRVHSPSGQPHLKAEELLRLQSHFRIDTTLFIEADKSNDEFRRIAAGGAPRLLGRNVGIFANTAEWYPGEDSFTGQRLSLVGPTVRTTLGNLKRAALGWHATPRYFYEEVIIKAKVLDELFVKDERLAAWRGSPVHWMPEISRPFGESETAEDGVAYLSHKEALETFLALNANREPVLYFGDAAYYKGYDLFLEFVDAMPSTCAIHAGRSYDAQQRSYFRSDVDLLREGLKRDGRLYETNCYVHTQRLKKLYFGAVRVYLTTHRLALSSSTVIQALELGKPVIVPNRGLLAHRVLTSGIGDVYAYGDLEDLRKKAKFLWQSDLSRFIEPASSFWVRFSEPAVRNFFAKRLVEA